MNEVHRQRLLELKGKIFAKSDEAGRNKLFREALMNRDGALIEALFQAGAGEAELTSCAANVFEAAFVPFNRGLTDLLLHKGWRIPTEAVIKLAEAGNQEATEFLFTQDAGLASQVLLSPLVCAWNPRVVRLCLEFGANPNIQDVEGTTPLMILANYWEGLREQRTCLKLILNAGALLDTEDNEGRTVYDYGGEWPDLRRLLK
jgi:hypothetical protein